MQLAQRCSQDSSAQQIPLCSRKWKHCALQRQTRLHRHRSRPTHSAFCTPMQACDHDFSQRSTRTRSMHGNFCSTLLPTRSAARLKTPLSRAFPVHLLAHSLRRSHHPSRAQSLVQRSIAPASMSAHFKHSPELKAIAPPCISRFRYSHNSRPLQATHKRVQMHCLPSRRHFHKVLARSKACNLRLRSHSTRSCRTLECNVRASRARSAHKASA